MNAAALRNRSPASQGREGEVSCFFIIFNISEMFFMDGVQNVELHIRLCTRGSKGE